MSAEYTIRPAEANDAEGIITLVRELAEFERALDKMKLTAQQLRHDGWKLQPPLFGAYVAESDMGKLVGLALFYYRYSTWKGKRLYLEDIIVTQSWRGRGLGKALLDIVTQHARDNACSGMKWQVLDWNTSAIEFYKRQGAEMDAEWIDCSLEF